MVEGRVEARSAEASAKVVASDAKLEIPSPSENCNESLSCKEHSGGMSACVYFAQR